MGCHSLAIIHVGGQAAGGIHFSIKNGTFGTGASFNDLFLLNFLNGTSINLEASGASGIAWSSFENIHIRNAKKGIHIDVDTDGSFINLVTFRSISMTGSGFDYGLLVDGPLSTTDWYGIAMQADCPTVGHIVLNSRGSVNIYGIDIPTRQELIAYERTEAEIAQKIGCDMVVYQDLSDLEDSVREAVTPGTTVNIPKFDTSCFSGTYVTGESIQDAYFDRLHAERNDGAKEQRKRGLGADASDGSDAGSTPAKKPMASHDGCESVSNDKRMGKQGAGAGCEPLSNQPVGLVR